MKRTKIKIQKRPYCDCPRFEVNVSGEKIRIIVPHEDNCLMDKDDGEYVRVSVFDENGKQIKKTMRLW